MPQRFQIGVKGVILVEDRVLLLKRSDEDGSFWEIPGGRMEAGEAIEQTLRRELQEELPGIARIEVGQILHAARVHDDGPGLVLLFYRVRADVPEIVLSDEHIGYCWAGPDDLPALEAGAGGVATFDYTLTAVRLALQSH